MGIGYHLKVARVGKKMKAQDLAQQVGINSKYLSRIENDKAPGVSVAILARLCRALGTEPNVVMEWHLSDDQESEAGACAFSYTNESGRQGVSVTQVDANPSTSR